MNGLRLVTALAVFCLVASVVCHHSNKHHEHDCPSSHETFLKVAGRHFLELDENNQVIAKRSATRKWLFQIHEDDEGHHTHPPQFVIRTLDPKQDSSSRSHRTSQKSHHLRSSQKSHTHRHSHSHPSKHHLFVTVENNKLVVKPHNSSDERARFFAVCDADTKKFSLESVSAVNDMNDQKQFVHLTENRKHLTMGSRHDEFEAVASVEENSEEADDEEDNKEDFFAIEGFLDTSTSLSASPTAEQQLREENNRMYQNNAGDYDEEEEESEEYIVGPPVPAAKKKSHHHTHKSHQRKIGGKGGKRGVRTSYDRSGNDDENGSGDEQSDGGDDVAENENENDEKDPVSGDENEDDDEIPKAGSFFRPSWIALTVFFGIDMLGFAYHLVCAGTEHRKHFLTRALDKLKTHMKHDKDGGDHKSDEKDEHKELLATE